MKKTLLIDDMKNVRATKTARTFQDGLYALKEEKWDVLLLDHDLGWNGEGRESTGYDILCWLEEHPEHLPNEIQIISMNPVGRKKMLELVDRLYPNKQFKFKVFPDDFMDDIIEEEPDELDWGPMSNELLEALFGKGDK